MRTRLAALLTTGIFALAGLAQAGADDELKGDLAKIQGKWSAKVGPNDDIPVVMEIAKNVVTFTITINGEDRVLKGEIKLDETKTPKQWDSLKFTLPDGNTAPDNLAIYELKDDMLKLCSGGPGNERPTEFKKGEMGPPNLIEFKREKAEKKDDKKDEKKEDKVASK